MIDEKRSISTQIIEGDFEGRTPIRRREVVWNDILPTSNFVQDERFTGNLIVKGNVGDNCIIQAGRNIQIDGNVGASALRAGGDILVKKGVFGRGYLDACGDIEVGSVENGNLISGGNITIHKGAMHSRLAADGKIIITDGKGILVGGRAKAGRAITAKRLGSPHITPTLLEIGIPPLLRDEHQRLKEKIELLEKQVDQAGKAVIHLEKVSADADNGLNGLGCLPLESSLQAQGGRSSGTKSVDDQARKLPLWRFRVAYLNKELEKYTHRFKTLEKVLSDLSLLMKGNGSSPKSECRINVAEEVYPGVKISIAWTVLEIMEILRGVAFFTEGGKVQWKPLG